MSNPLKNTQKIQGGLAHQKCYARVQPGHSVPLNFSDDHSVRKIGSSGSFSISIIHPCLITTTIDSPKPFFRIQLLIFRIFLPTPCGSPTKVSPKDIKPRSQTHKQPNSRIMEPDTPEKLHLQERCRGLVSSVACVSSPNMRNRGRLVVVGT